VLAEYHIKTKIVSALHVTLFSNPLKIITLGYSVGNKLSSKPNATTYVARSL